MGGRFEGQVAVVTGAAKGIGAALARRLLAEDARVVGADVDSDGVASIGIASYGDTLKIADNLGNSCPPCVCALSEK